MYQSKALGKWIQIWIAHPEYTAEDRINLGGGMDGSGYIQEMTPEYIYITQSKDGVGQGAIFPWGMIVETAIFNERM